MVDAGHCGTVTFIPMLPYLVHDAQIAATLREGIANWVELRPALTAQDVRERALRPSRCMSFGTFRIRTHADTGSPVAVGALLDPAPSYINAGLNSRW